MKRSEREIVANKLKSIFNLIWQESININSRNGHTDTVSYMDIVRIGDAIRADGADILGIKKLPQQIESSLKFAAAALDPNAARAKENIKNGMAGLSGAGGLAMAYICLAQLMNPGLWAGFVAFFAGGIAAGPFAIVGIAGGLLVAAGAIYTALQKFSPQEKTAKAHKFVMDGIDNWIEYGDQDIPVSKQQAQDVVVKQAAQSATSRLSLQDIVAIATILLNIANADGSFVPQERMAIQTLMKNQNTDSRIKTVDALEHIRKLDVHQVREVVDWCFQIAHADDIFHENEVDALKRYCQSLCVDFVPYAQKYGIKLSFSS